MDTLMFDVIVVGGGPAGLSAALILGRCRRRVLVIDEGKPRNARSRSLNGFLTRDGTPPEEFLALGRQELLKYDVDFRLERVVAAARVEDRFEMTLRDGSCFMSKKLLLTTGVQDVLPEIEGIDELYGTSVHHCPYCDGWEVRDEPVAAYGQGNRGVGLALTLRIWTTDVVLLTDGQGSLDSEDKERLSRSGIAVRPEPIARLEGRDGRLEQIVFREGPPLPRTALFFNTGQQQQSELPAMLGCQFNRKGTVMTNRQEGTGIPGLFIAGDASWDVQYVIVAAAEGAKAAIAINKELHREEIDLTGLEEDSVE